MYISILCNFYGHYPRYNSIPSISTSCVIAISASA